MPVVLRSGEAIEKTLLTASQLSAEGLWGSPLSTGDATEELGYSRGPFAIRYVGEERRIILAAGSNYSGSQHWHAGDLFEFTAPATYAAGFTTNAAPLDEELAVVAGRQWAKEDWQVIGISEPSSGIMPGGGWWDETQQVLWYTAFPYYSAQPMACLAAVALNNDGTCTRYGPWHYANSTSSAWKKVCMWLTPIPAAQQAAMNGYTHLMGGSPMSMGGQAHWGLGLVAVNLPTLQAAVFGLAEAHNNNTAGTTIIVETTQDLSTIPTDGTVAFFFDNYGAPGYNRFTIPSSVTETSPNVWEIVGSVSYPACASDSKKNWALTWIMPAGQKIADFSPDDSGLAWPQYFQHRPDNYYNCQGDLDLNDDPYIGGRVGGGSETYGPETVQAVDGLDVTLPADASAVDGAYVDKFIRFENNTPAGIYYTVRKIVAYDGDTRTATVDAAFDVAPTTSSTFTIRTQTLDPDDWNGASTAIPDPVGGVGFFQASMDNALSAVWVDRPSAHGFLMFGTQVSGATWYHFWDTYRYFDVTDQARSGSSFNGSYGYRSEATAAKLYLYNPVHLLESAAETRSFNAEGMEYVDGGDWSTLFAPFPTYRESSVFPGKHIFYPAPAEGGSQLGIVDETANQLIVMFPECYSPNNGVWGRPLFAVFDLPSKV